VSYHLHGKKFLPCIQSKSTLFQFKTIVLCPITTGLHKKYLSVFHISPLDILKGCNKVSPEPSLLQAEQAQLSQNFFTGESLLISFVASSGLALTIPCLSSAGDPRAGRSTAGGSSGAEPSPSTCWPHCFGYSPEHSLLSGLQGTLPAPVQFFFHLYLQGLLYRGQKDSSVASSVVDSLWTSAFRKLSPNKCCTGTVAEWVCWQTELKRLG